MDGILGGVAALYLQALPSGSKAKLAGSLTAPRQKSSTELSLTAGKVRRSEGKKEQKTLSRSGWMTGINVSKFDAIQISL